MIPPTVVTIVLAAGSSGRLGTHKALLHLENRSAIVRVIQTSLASNSDQTVVVLGAHSESIRREIGDLPVSVVENVNFALGRTGSLKCALQSLVTGCYGNDTAIIIFPVDCPFVPSLVLNKLIACLLSNVSTVDHGEKPVSVLGGVCSDRQASVSNLRLSAERSWSVDDENSPAGMQSASLWIHPEYSGRRGHPVLLSGPILSHVLKLADDFPLKDFLYEAEKNQVLCRHTVKVDTASVLDNINTTDDLVRVLKREGLT
ncbi:MAG: NTP transferase domain-containing protein [Candidatus Melainabacteria bacterium]|nr:NTP transferase domain-containing protein [Candidatus Melainabacteria bacterium]